MGLKSMELRGSLCLYFETRFVSQVFVSVTGGSCWLRVAHRPFLFARAPGLLHRSLGRVLDKDGADQVSFG